MRDGIVSIGDAVVERLTLGFVNAVSSHPIVLFSLFLSMLVTVVVLWVQMMEIRPDMLRSSAKRDDDRPMRFRR